MLGSQLLSLAYQTDLTLEYLLDIQRLAQCFLRFCGSPKVGSKVIERGKGQDRRLGSLAEANLKSGPISG